MSHHFFPKSHYYPPHHHYSPYHSPYYSPHYSHHPCRCECSKHAAMNAKPMHGNPHHHHLSKMKPMHDLPIHSLNGHPINGHPLNRPHHLNGHPINGHAINGHATTGHSMPYERPHFKLNEPYKSRDKHDAAGHKPDKTLDKPNGDFPKLPPNELMSQLVDFDTGYMLPKHGHPAMQSVMQDRYRRLIYGQFLDGNLMSPSNYLYEPFSVDQPNGRPPTKAGKPAKKKPMRKEMEHLQLQNGGQMHLIKMGMIK